MLKALLPQIVSLADKAGRAIMEIYADRERMVITKADNSPLTQADLMSDRIIRAGLDDLGLGFPLLSEEFEQVPYIERQNWRRFWLIDPLDGTKEFVQRNDEFTVNIALVENGTPILGVVCAPALDVSYYGALGVGAFVRRGNAQPEAIEVKPYVDSETIKIVLSRSHSDDRTRKFLDTLGNHECTSMGSSLKICLVAEGRAHLYPRLGPTMEWDTAAAQAVVSFAGGKIQDREGRQLKYNKPDLRNVEFFVCSEHQALSKAIYDFNE